MTATERKEKYLKKAYERNLDVTNQEKLTEFAIKLDKKNYRWRCIGCIVGAIICFVIGIGLNDAFEETKMLLIVMSVSAVFEFFRTIRKYKKVETIYGSVSRKVEQRKLLTKRIVNLDVQKSLSKDPNAEYKLCKVQLLDKEDEEDVGIMNDMYHKYYLHFKAEGKNYRYKIKGQQYLDSVIGEEFYIVIAEKYGKIVAAYNAASWELDEELSKEVHSYSTQDEEIGTHFSYNSICENKKEIQQENKKPGRILSIVSLVCSVLMLEVSILFGTVLVLTALVLGILAVKREKTTMAKISLAVSIIAVLLNVFGYWYVISTL